jgi:hypothetical protein
VPPTTASAPPGRRLAAPLLALLLGVVLVAIYDHALSDRRYPYSADSASYIDMAVSLRSAGRPLVTPWGLEFPAHEAVPQPLFPPGFAMLIAAFVPLTGDAVSAALLPSRVAAALLPLLIVVLFRGLASDAALLGLGAWALLGPGLREWHYLAYSDVACLALAVCACGALLRGLAADAAAVRARWLLLAGLAAGGCYALRNAALALLATMAATLLYEAWRERATRRAAAACLAGLTVPLAALLAYNLRTFGALQPYAMPPSTRSWTANLGDWAVAQLTDLDVTTRLAVGLTPPVALMLAALLVAGGALLFWQTHGRPDTHRAVALLGGYAVAGAVLLVVSRSRYEWGDTIGSRHALQYSWALGLVAVLSWRTLAPARWCALGRGAAGCLLLAGAAAAVADVVAARRAGAESWLDLAHDSALLAGLRALPADALIASNAAALFRIGTDRRVRQIDTGGDDAAFAGSLLLLRHAAGRRRGIFVLVCDGATGDFSACATPPRAAGPPCRRVRSAPPAVWVCEAADEDGLHPG